MEYRFDLPTADTRNQVLGAFFGILDYLGFELGSRYDEVISKTRGVNWFAELQVERDDHSHASMYDPHFVLSEPYFHADSPTRECLPRTEVFYSLLKGTRRIRNSWSHANVEPNFANLEKDLKYLQQFAHACGLELQGLIMQVRTRIRDIVERGWSPGQEANQELEAELARMRELVAKLSNEDVKSQFDRAQSDIRHVEEVERLSTSQVVGRPWVGVLGQRILKLLKNTRDLYDPAKQCSVRSEITGDVDVELSHWFDVMPVGGDLFVDANGAVAGSVRGVMRCIGYLGDSNPTATSDGLSGFFTLVEYEVHQGKIRNVVSRQELSDLTLDDDVRIELLEGSSVRVTTSGHLAIYDDDAETWKRVGVASSAS